MNELMYKWGVRYIALGYSIIPVRPKGKEPLIDWKEFQSRRATEQELRQWLEKWPEMNLGIVTGELSSVAVVDFDGTIGLKECAKLKLVSSVVQLTGNGKQVFYKWYEGIRNSASKIAPNVDIRGSGGFVVVCPSIHPNAKLYRWERFVPDRIPEFPLEILTNLATTESTYQNSKSEDWINAALEELRNGHTHNNLVSILGKFRCHNFSITDTTALLLPHAEIGGMSQTALESKIREIWGRYEPKEIRSISALSMAYQSSGLSIKSPSNDDDWKQFTSVSKDTSAVINTGFKTLDAYCEGGFKSERLFTIAARTGTGKTNFALALSKNLCRQNQKVLYFSTEFGYRKIWSRYSSYGEFRYDPFSVCDSFSPNLNQVEEAIKQVNPNVFIFDHINHLGEEREGLGAFMQGCNFLQRKYDAQGIMAAQLNRQADWVENGKRIEPRMSMIKGSGTIEQASSRVLLLSETRQTPEMNEIIGVLDKNDSGDRGVVQFGLYKNPYIFREI